MCPGAALGLAALPAAASNPDKQWNKGCADAKAGSYDRAHPTDAYERGWQSCNLKGDDSANEGANRQKEWDRGCADSKAKTYDRARHNADYAAGWNACTGD